MFSKSTVFSFLLAVIIGHQTSGQTTPGLSCIYSINTAGVYTCTLTIFNPNGLNNFTTIDGDHLGNRIDMDVRNVVATNTSRSSNIPRIICDRFRFLDSMTLTQIFITEINADAFTNCSWLRGLGLDSNLIMSIAPNAFASNRFLSSLSINSNYLENLPQHIFSPLINLESLYINQNFLQILHADIFGQNPVLEVVSMSNNRIHAVSPNVFNNTNIRTLMFFGNICFNQNIFWEDRNYIMRQLAVCTRNYENVSPPDPVPPPGGCSQRNIFDRVCEIEDEVVEQRSTIEELSRNVDELARIVEELTKKVNDLTRGK